MNKISGVYKITNNITNDFYIGSSKDVNRRWSGHRCISNWKQRPDSKLYKDMAKYGRDNFKFEIIEETTELKEREQYFIDLLKPSYNNYNAYGQNIERQTETHRSRGRTYYANHKEQCLSKSRSYYKSHRNELREKYRTRNKALYSMLCLYEGETLTLNALTSRFVKKGIAHARLEAKKYLLDNN